MMTEFLEFNEEDMANIIEIVEGDEDFQEEITANVSIFVCTL